jgi:hypothetical protein
VQARSLKQHLPLTNQKRISLPTNQKLISHLINQKRSHLPIRRKLLRQHNQHYLIPVVLGLVVR